MNKALLGKWLWRLGDELDGLGSQIIFSKNNVDNEGLHVCIVDFVIM